MSILKYIVGKPYIPTSNASNIRELWLVAGQSNTEGVLGTPYPSIYNVDNTVTGIKMWARSEDSFQTYQLGAGSVQRSGAYDNDWAAYGFDILLLKQLSDLQGKDIYVVKTAKGGTAMHPDYDKGTWYMPYDEVLQNGFLSMSAYTKQTIELAIRKSTVDGFAIRFKGLIWHQGESDYLPIYENQWKPRFLELLRNIRIWTRNARLPVVMGTIPTASTMFSAVIKSDMLGLPASDPNISVIDLSDIPLGTDSLHFNASGAVTASTRYFNIAKNL